MERSLTKRGINAWWHLAETPFFFSVTLSFPPLSLPCQLARRFIIQRGIWDDRRGIERRREKMVDDHLSLIDSFLNAVDDLGIVKRTAKYNERTRRFDGFRRFFWSGIVLTRDRRHFIEFFFFFLSNEYIRVRSLGWVKYRSEYKSIFENKLWT